MAMALALGTETLDACIGPVNTFPNLDNEAKFNLETDVDWPLGFRPDGGVWSFNVAPAAGGQSYFTPADNRMPSMRPGNVRSIGFQSPLKSQLGVRGMMESGLSRGPRGLEDAQAGPADSKSAEDPALMGSPTDGSLPDTKHITQQDEESE